MELDPNKVAFFIKNTRESRLVEDYFFSKGFIWQGEKNQARCNVILFKTDVYITIYHGKIALANQIDTILHLNKTIISVNKISLQMEFEF